MTPPSLLADAWGADWAWGLSLIVLTVAIHVLGLNLVVEKVEQVLVAFAGRFHVRVLSMATVSATAWLTCILLGLEVMIWSVTYRLIGALPDYHTAVLYSLGAMTTYGHANLLLQRRWQLLGALESLDGVLLFGLTTAVLIHILQKGSGAIRQKRPDASS